MEDVAEFQDWEFLAPSDGELEHNLGNSSPGSESVEDYFTANADVWNPNRLSFPESEPAKNISPCEGNSDLIEFSANSGSIPDESPNLGFHIQREDLNETPIVGPVVNLPEEAYAEEICNDPKLTDPDQQLEIEKLPITPVKKAGFFWWKLPVELLKFLALRIRPAWSVTMAAALMGAFMLGRKLYKKKPKSRRIPLKVAPGDKVSPFQVPVSRLNEAFSAVKRVPVIRASLPAAGATPWPLVALR